MGYLDYDWELIDRLDKRNRAASKAYRCPFVDAIKGRAPHSHGPKWAFLDRAIEILAFKANPSAMVGEKVRGEVYRREATDRPPPYHYKPVCVRANVVSGEFTARPAPHYIEDACPTT